MKGKEDRNADCFDRLMDSRPFLPFAPFYRRHKSVLLYLLFGGLTTGISAGSFALFHCILSADELFANGLSWLISVSFAYATNRIWVFENKARRLRDIGLEAARFFSARLLTLAVEEAALFVFAVQLRLHSMAVKGAAQILVIVLNYAISRAFVFT